jgi:hypothetical protein
MDNFDLKKYLAEGRLLKKIIISEAYIPTYPEGKLSVEDKIKAIVPLWQQYQSTSDKDVRFEIKEKISRYTTYNIPIGSSSQMASSSYVGEILFNAKSVEDVARIIKREEDQLSKGEDEQSDYSVELLVPRVYFNVETGELSDNKNEWFTDDELKAGADQTTYTRGEELDMIVFDNDYNQAKSFEKQYPNLIRVN